MADKFEILIQGALDESKLINNINTQLKNIGNKIEKLHFKVHIDSSGLAEFATQAQKEQLKIQKVFKESKISGDGYGDLQQRLSSIRNSTDQYAKATIQTYKNTKNLKSATIEYRDELGRLVKEQMKWTQYVDKANGVQKKVFQTTGFTFVDDLAKKEKTLDSIASKLNKMQQSSMNLGTKIGFLAPGTENLLQHQLNRYQNILNDFKKKNEQGIFTTPEQLSQLQNIENRIKRFYETTKKAQSDSHGFDFKQFESFNRLSPAIQNATQAQEYYNKSILEGWKLLRTSTQETEHYIKVSQGLRQGNILKDVGIYVDKSTGNVYKFNESLKDTMVRSWGVGAALKTAFEKAVTWTVVMGGMYGFIGLLQQIPGIIVEIDTRLTEMAKVMSADTDFGLLMNELSQSANSYGRTITETQDSVIEFAKQGYEAAQAIELANTALLGANVTGMKTGEMAEYLTGVLAQFNMTAEQSVEVVNKINEVDNNYSVTSQGLAQSIAKAGETAQQFGVTLDDLIGMTTAISTATRESGRVVGNSLKFMFPRINSDNAIKALASIKINTKDVSGELRSATQIYSEVAAKWDLMSRAQRTYVAESLAKLAA